MWDVFISHAAEDKEQIARPLAEALAAAGLKVWYDDFTLRLGDSLGTSIDRGLAESRYGIVVLSGAFFSKEWPRRELDGLTAREISSGKLILPIWHRVSRAEVERFSPVLADRLGVSTDRGLDAVVAAVVAAMHERPLARPSPMDGRRARRRALGVTATVLLAAGLGAALSRDYWADDDAGVSGTWVIAATQKTPETHLTLSAQNSRLTGKTRMLFSDHPDMVLSGLQAQQEAAILDGQSRRGRIAFRTRRVYSPDFDRSRKVDLVHNYEGQIDGERIRFAVQVDRGYYEEVIAIRKAEDNLNEESSRRNEFNSLSRRRTSWVR